MIWWIISISFWIIPTLIVWGVHWFGDEFELNKSIWTRILASLPLVSLFIFIMFLYEILEEHKIFKNIGNFFENFADVIDNIINRLLDNKITYYFEKKRKRRESLKIRRKKIKLGIIRITPLDPYGEENWNE